MGINTSSSTGLQWLVQMLQLLSADAIQIPTDYRSQVLEVKQILEKDTSGLVNTVLDFASQGACVDYTIETKNERWDALLNNWLKDINVSLLGTIPTGFSALAKEYFRERWKGSSHLVLRMSWETVDGWILPTKMWFLDGEDIVVERKTNDGTNRIGDVTYSLLIDQKTKKVKPLPTTDTENFFVQKPYESWSILRPTPFLIRRGIYRNMRFYDLLTSKGEHIVQKAIEYMMFLRKGTERLASMGQTDFIYSQEDLQKITDEFTKFVSDRRVAPANQVPTYAANFDTQIDHLIPEYERALKQILYTPLERRILAGLGMVDIVEGTSSTRRDAILNPKPLRSEVQGGINDLASLLGDIVKKIIQRNKARHPKQTKLETLIRPSPLKEFLTDNGKTLIRSAYDRGLLSKETTTELIADVDFDVEVKRREIEREKKYEDLMFPPVIQNMEGVSEDEQTDNPDDEVPDDRNPDAPEGDNFNQATHHDRKSRRRRKSRRPKPQLVKYSDEELEDVEDEDADLTVAEVTTPDYEEAPWKRNSDLPKSVKVLPSTAQTLWRRVANSVLADGGSEERAIRIAWSQVKKQYHKNKDGEWVKSSTDSSDTS